MLTPKLFKITYSSKVLNQILSDSKTIVFGHLINKNSNSLLNLKKNLFDLQSGVKTISPKIVSLLFKNNKDQIFNIAKGNVVIIYPLEKDLVFTKKHLQTFLKLKNIQVIALLDNKTLYRLEHVKKLQTLNENTFLQRLFTFKNLNVNLSKNLLKLRKNF